LWYYLYKRNDDANLTVNLQILLNATTQITHGLTIAELDVAFPNTKTFYDGMWDAVDFNEVTVANAGALIAAFFWDGVVGWCAKLFHPQMPYHLAIKDLAVNQFLEDTQVGTAA
jgi:hypothetical protein